MLHTTLISSVFGQNSSDGSSCLSSLTSNFQLQQILLENWLIGEATRIERAALELALLGEVQQQYRHQNFDEKERKPKIVKMEYDGQKGANSEECGGEQFMTRCGIAWKHLANMAHQSEFDKLRRAHQVSKNRHVGYGVRYACTRNAKARDNCPYLMLCMPGSDGTLKVYYRNAHTHPIRQIRAREMATTTAQSPSKQ